MIADHSDGFSIIEVLVGLAVASIVLMALGLILSFAAAAQGRSAESELVLGTLVDVEALSTELEDYGTSILSASADAVALQGIEDPALSVALVLDGKKLSVNVNGRQRSVLGFSMFDDVKLEAFSKVDSGFSWRPLDGVATEQMLLLRVALGKGRRHWSVVIWSRLGVTRPLAYDSDLPVRRIDYV